MDIILTGREKLVLDSIIKTFIEKVVPVSSRYIAKKYNNLICSATIRNVMIDLEEKGYIKQPHTSAGRIPTDKGYRYYVDGLMQVEDLAQHEKDDIKLNLFGISSNIEQILEKSCQTLSKISNLLGVVLSPRFLNGVFKKLELVKLSENAILVIIFIASGLVKTITMEVHSDIKKEKLEETTRILNERLQNLTLKEIYDSIGMRLHDINMGDQQLIKHVVESSDKLFIHEEEHVHIGGTQNIMRQPEFTDIDEMIKILELIDNKKIFIHILNEHGSDEKITITIGEENKKELVMNCSLVLSTYKIGNLTGTMGIIGPTRMYYPKMISLVDYIAKEVSDLFNNKREGV